MQDDKLDSLIKTVKQRIADLEEMLLDAFDYDTVVRVNQLYELLNNLCWGGQIPPAEREIIGEHNAGDVEALINEVARTVRKHTTR